MDEKDFYWRVQAGAYRWGETISPEPLGRGQSPRSIFVGMGDTSTEPVRTYFPLREHTGLFRTFAETEPTENGILAFIERFGMLLAANITPAMKRSPGSSGRATADVLAFHVEPFDFWRREIRTMRLANLIWEMLGERDNDDLVAHFVAWRRDAAGPCAVEFDSHARLAPGKSPPAPDVRIVEPIVTRDEGTEWFARCLKGGAVLAARLGLERLVNRRLEGHLGASFTLDPSGQMGLRVQPKNLLQAIWLQFGLAVSEAKKYRQCVVCQTWFELSPELARTNRRFCSIRCKNREYRNRQDQARQLRSAGMEPREIAKKLETTVAVVKGWIKAGS